MVAGAEVVGPRPCVGLGTVEGVLVRRVDGLELAVGVAEGEVREKPPRGGPGNAARPITGCACPSALLLVPASHVATNSRPPRKTPRLELPTNGRGGPRALECTQLALLPKR